MANAKAETVASAPTRNHPHFRLRDGFIDTWLMTKRNLIRYRRIPSLIVFATIQPIMFLLLFNYVFGGAIQTGDDNYINFLLPGIIVQAVLFGTTQTSYGLAQDMIAGIVERFKSLPMNRGAVILGRTISDTARNVLVVIIMLLLGYLIGFRTDQSFWLLLAGLATVLAFGFAFMWTMTTIGLYVKDPESTNTASFLFIFPMVFASPVYVPAETMPGWLQAFVNNQPVTHAIDAARGLMFGGALDGVWKTAIWIGVLLIVFIPISVHRYRQTT